MDAHSEVRDFAGGLFDPAFKVHLQALDTNLTKWKVFTYRWDERPCVREGLIVREGEGWKFLPEVC